MKNGHVRDRFFTRDRGGGGGNPRKRMKKTDEEDRKIWRLKNTSIGCTYMSAHKYIHAKNAILYILISNSDYD